MRNAARTPRRAHARSSSGFARRGRAHEHEVPRPVGEVVDRCDGLDAEHRRRLEVRRADLARVARREDVVQRDEPELARVGRRPGDDHAARLEQRGESLAQVPNRRRGHPCVPRRRRFAGRSSSTSASTATGLPSTTMSGFRSTAATSGRSVGEPRQARRASRASAPRSTAGSPRNGPSSFCVARSSISSSASRSVERHEAERDVAERLGEHAADAEHHARPELRVADEPGDELAGAAHHRRDEQLDRAVVGVGRGEQLAGRVAHGGARRAGRAARGRARSCARSRRRTASPRPGSRSRRPRRPPRRRRPRCARRAPARRSSASSCFDAASERVGTLSGEPGGVLIRPSPGPASTRRAAPA